MSVPHWRTATLVAAALVVGVIVAPPLAQAAATATSLFRLEGGGSSNVAKVSSSGQLSVNTGLTQTAAHQILAAEASPSSYVAAVGDTTNCSAGGIYQIPAGDAFILTGADFDHVALSTGPPEDSVIRYGPSATPCTSIAAFSVGESQDATDNQVFQPGIAIPAGDAIGLSGPDNGGIEIYGYLVPTSEVPQHAATAGSGRTSFLPPPKG